MKLHDAFVRLDPGTVRDDFLGRMSTDLLAGIKTEIYEKAGKIHELTINLIGPYEILLNREMRKKIIAALPQGEAEKLSNDLKLMGSKDAYKKLDELRIKKETESEKALLAFFGVEKPETEPVVTQPDVETIKPQMGLFEHQRSVVKESIKMLDADPRRLLIHMPTGAGKTRIAMRIITHYLLEKEPTLVIWLAYSEELCEQAVEEFSETWKRVGNRELNVHRFFGKHAINEDRLPSDGFLVAGLSKTYTADTSGNKSLFLPKLAANTDMVVMDEAHQAVAETYKYVIEQLTGRHGEQKLLGLTATPGRTWNDPDVDKKLSEFFRKNKVTLNKDNPIKFLVDRGYLADVKIEPLSYQNDFTEKEKHDIMAELEIPKYILEKLAGDVRRSLKILSSVQTLIYEGHKRIILFAATVEHAKALTAGLMEKGINAQYITADTPADVRSLRIRKYKEDSEEARVICNYGVLTTGFDAPRTSAAVIARPTKSLVLYSQMAGRAMRGPRAGGNREAKIISVADIELPGFGDLGEAFLNWEDIW